MSQIETRKNKIIYTALPLGFIGVLVPVVLFLFLQKAFNFERNKFELAANQTVARIFFEEAKNTRVGLQAFRDDFNWQSLDLGKEKLSVKELSSLKKSLERGMFGFSRIDSLVMEELKNQNIFTKYSYAFSVTKLKVNTDKGHKTIVGENVPCQALEIYRNGKLEGRAIRHTFYYIGEKDYIEICLQSNFPAKQWVLLSNMRAEIAISLIVFLVVIVLLFLTVKNLYRQKRISEMKSDFINNITHEFNTPLSTITLVSSLLKKQLGDAELVSSNASIIERQAARLKQMVNNAMDLSLFSNGERGIKLEKKSVHRLIDACVDEYLLKLNALTVSKHFTESDDHILIDEFYLTTVMNNLIDNAIKYSDKPRVEVMVETLRKGGEFVIRFRDNGPGVSREDRQKLFGKFYRGSIGKGNTKGLGLGLHLVKCAVNAHKGSIELDKCYEAGLGFVIKFPILKSSDEEA
jgi:signal transduction histidine kinase